MSRPVPERRASAACHHGFTLVEVVIAASLLLLTVICATPLLTGSQRAASRESRSAEAQCLAQSTVERLRSLPFVPPSTPQTATAAEPDGCVVGALFPHADQARNGPDDFVVLADGGPWPAGTFVTRRRAGTYLVTTETRFIAATAGGFAAVSTTRLAGTTHRPAASCPPAHWPWRYTWVGRTRPERSVTRRDTLLDRSCAATAVALAWLP